MSLLKSHRAPVDYLRGLNRDEWIEPKGEHKLCCIGGRMLKKRGGEFKDAFKKVHLSGESGADQSREHMGCITNDTFLPQTISISSLLRQSRRKPDRLQKWMVLPGNGTALNAEYRSPPALSATATAATSYARLSLHVYGCTSMAARLRLQILQCSSLGYAPLLPTADQQQTSFAPLRRNAPLSSAQNGIIIIWYLIGCC